MRKGGKGAYRKRGDLEGGREERGGKIQERGIEEKGGLVCEI